MSGGHYDYIHYRIDSLADTIEEEFKDGDCTRISDVSISEKKEILNEINSLIIDLRKCSARTKALDYYISGDTGTTTYLEEVKNI